MGQFLNISRMCEIFVPSGDASSEETNEHPCKHHPHQQARGVNSVHA